MSDEPLTEEELALIEREATDAKHSNETDNTGWHRVTLEADEVRRLVAEVRRLRAEVQELEDEMHLDHCGQGIGRGCEECIAIRARRTKAP